MAVQSQPLVSSLSRSRIRRTTFTSRSHKPLHGVVLGKIGQKKTPWSESASELYRPSERPPLVGEVIANFLRIEGATWSA
jgi:hypothetical protein